MHPRRPHSLSFPGAREARFLVSLETGQWWKGVPEQVCTYLLPTHSTILLGITKLNQHATGTSQLGYRKPYRFHQETRPLFYNLSDEEHLRAFYRTFLHLLSYSAGLQRGPDKYRYYMELGERRVLCRTPLQLRRQDAGFEDYLGEEVLELLCENANYRNPHPKCHATSGPVREAACAEWRRKCAPQKAYRFRIRRVLRKGSDEVRAATINDCTELTLPLEVAEKLAERLPDMLRRLWSYSLRHPEQVEVRHDHCESTTRMQLHRLPAFEHELLPRLPNLTFEPRWQLFCHKRADVQALQEKPRLPLYEAKACILTLVALSLIRTKRRRGQDILHPSVAELSSTPQIQNRCIEARPRAPP